MNQKDRDKLYNILGVENKGIVAFITCINMLDIGDHITTTIAKITKISENKFEISVGEDVIRKGIGEMYGEIGDSIDRIFS